MRWAITTLVLAGIFLLFAFWRLPNIFMRGIVRRFGRRIAPKPDHGSQRALSIATISRSEVYESMKPEGRISRVSSIRKEPAL